MGKDIVLHVSATNPAAFLYLKFGFKIEEIIQNFYENYQQTEDSKHALYLRLSRWCEGSSSPNCAMEKWVQGNFDKDFLNLYEMI